MNNEAVELKESGVMGEFFSFIADFQSIIALMAKLAIAAPLLDFIFKVGPPWPSRSATAFFVIVMQILILIYGFEFWRQKSAAIKKVRDSLKYFIFGTPIALLIYIVLFTFFVVTITTDQTATDSNGKEVVTRYSERFVTGYQLQPKVAKAHSDASVKELLALYGGIGQSEKGGEAAGQNLDKIWTPTSMKLTNLMLLLSWLGLWLGISLVISAFTAIQWKRNDRKKTKAKTKSKTMPKPAPEAEPEPHPETTDSEPEAKPEVAE